MTDYLLQLDSYGVSFAEKNILRDVTINVPPYGMSVLMGPAGTGKSTLLRTLSGANDASPSLQTSGSAFFQGKPLGELGLPAIVMQKTRLMMASLRENIVSELPERNNLRLSQQREIAVRLLNNADLGYLGDNLERRVVDLTLGEQRLVALVRTIASNPKMILVDEPTSGISEEEADKILVFLKKEAAKRSVVTVLHNQIQARNLGGSVILIAGGRVIESGPCLDFFSDPVTQEGRDFIRTGSCCVASLDADESTLDVDFSPSKKSNSPLAITKRNKRNERVIKSDAFGPRNFLWLKKGVLAGTPRPGLTLDIELDLAAIKRVGVTVLVSLESEFEAIPQATLSLFAIKGIAFPIRDMSVPTLEAAKRLCCEVDALIKKGESVAFHCKAGIGRTGTMLVAVLMWQGMTALDALESARKIEPRWVQSQEQVEFLEEFEVYISNFSRKSDGGAPFFSKENNDLESYL